jgi:hypothetical protein
LPPGAVQFEIWSGYNPLPAKPVKTAKGEDKDASFDQTFNNELSDHSGKRPANIVVEKSKGPPPTGASFGISRSAVVKAPMQKGAPQ